MKRFFSSATGRIVTALLAGILFGMLANYLNWQTPVINYLKPVGDAFIKMLRAIAIPLIIFSLSKGIIDLKDISKLSKLGGKTIFLYLFTTVTATFLGLLLANIIQPGAFVPPDLLNQYQYIGESNTVVNEENAILQLIPSNLLATFSDNAAMLSVIFITLVFAIAVLKSSDKTRTNLGQLFSDFNEVIMKVIDFIMWLAPAAVFALMAALVVETPHSDLLLSMLIYVFTVVLGLALLTFGFYPILVKYFTNMPMQTFLKGISKAQLMGISTSSSAASLPVTMECTQESLAVSNETASFVLPLGATCNMDGTSMYQAVAALFVAQLYGLDLSLFAQLGIVATAVLGSIGAAAVPGGGIVMLTIVLEQAGLPLSGLGVILALDRPLDMLRTAVNITSDAAVAKIIDSTKS
jgi:Na+/H+-dicarboxylate symporter